MRCALLFLADASSIATLEFCKQQGHTVEQVLFPQAEDVDSPFYSPLGAELLTMVAGCVSLPAGKEISSQSQLEQALSDQKSRLRIEALATGLIQNRLHHVSMLAMCKELGLQLLTPWYKSDHLQQLALLHKQGYRMIISAVSGMPKEFLGTELDDDLLQKLAAQTEGTFSTLVTAGPLFTQEIRIKIGYPKAEDSMNGVFLVKEVEFVPPEKAP